MAIYESKKIKQILRSRLRTQRRLLTFDDDQILVLPDLEHPDIEKAIDDIKFLIDKKGNSITFDRVEKIEIKDKFIVHTKTDKHTLHQRCSNGDLQPVLVSKNNKKLNQLTIEHSPSIQIVLFSHYINKTNEFKTLSDFTRSLGKSLNSSSIKAAGFKEKVIKKKQKKGNKEQVAKAYACIFENIELEILHKDKNHSSLSLESLEYYKKNNP